MLLVLPGQILLSDMLYLGCGGRRRLFILSSASTHSHSITGVSHGDNQREERSQRRMSLVSRERLVGNSCLINIDQ